MAVFKVIQFFRSLLVFQVDLNFEQQVRNYRVALGATPSPGLKISMDIHLDSREFLQFGANKLGLCPTWPFPAHLTQTLGFWFLENNFAYIWLNLCDFAGNSGQVRCLWRVSHVISDENHPTTRTARLHPHNQSKYSLPTALKHPLIIKCKQNVS